MLGSAGEPHRKPGVGCHGEGASGSGLPDVLLVVVVLGRDDDLFGDEVGTVETDTELTDHADVGACGERLHEGLRSRLGDGSEGVDEIGLGHANASVLNGQGVVGLVRDEADPQRLLRVERGGVREPRVADLVEGIGGVGNQLAKEDALVGVEGVNDQRHQLADVC